MCQLGTRTSASTLLMHSARRSSSLFCLLPRAAKSAVLRSAPCKAQSSKEGFLNFASPYLFNHIQSVPGLLQQGSPHAVSYNTFLEGAGFCWAGS